jgi:hypothetical protein
MDSRGMQPALLDLYANVFGANPALRSLTMRSIASAPTEQHPNIRAPIDPPSQFQSIKLNTLVLRDFFITNPELTALLASQTALQHLTIARPSHLSVEPIKGVVAGIEPIKSQLKTLAIESFPPGSAIQLLAISIPNLVQLTVEEMKLNRGTIIDACPPTLEHLALYRTDFGATNTSAFVTNLKRCADSAL